MKGKEIIKFDSVSKTYNMGDKISGLSIVRGVAYFTLKDETANLACFTLLFYQVKFQRS